MLINIYSVSKNDKEFKELNEKYIKLISSFAKINDKQIFSKKIAKAKDEKSAKLAYEAEFIPLKKGYSVVLDEKGLDLNSKEFASLIEDRVCVSFFIAGAYGLEDEFKKSFDLSLRLSSLTLAHKFAKCLLLEQIYRAFCINTKHPYHK